MSKPKHRKSGTYKKAHKPDPNALNRKVRFVQDVCPCGGEFIAGRRNNDKEFLTHSEPPCKAFRDKGSTEYLLWVHAQRTTSDDPLSAAP